MYKIPLSAVPNQSLNIVLDEQNCTIHIYQRGDYLYLDLSVNDTVIRQGAICLVDINLLNYPRNGFSGYLFFSDLLNKYGTPSYNLLNDRYILFFATEDELEEVAESV